MVKGVVRVIFTLDYEIHGNGEGCPYELMVEPTARLLHLFDAYGAKLTIMADIAEILKFKQYADQHGKDDYHYRDIAAQLQTAVRGGHDVQLHIHSSYFNATHDGRRSGSEPDGGRVRIPAGSVVEPGGGSAGGGPRAPHRADAPGVCLPVDCARPGGGIGDRKSV